jgi:hypothetical protein
MPVEEVQQYLGALESQAYSNVVKGYWSQLLTGSSETTRAKAMQDLRDTPKATIVSVSKNFSNTIPRRHWNVTMGKVIGHYSDQRNSFSVHKPYVQPSIQNDNRDRTLATTG